MSTRPSYRAAALSRVRSVLGKVAIVLAAFAIGVGLAELLGAKNLGTSFGVGQLTFAVRSGLRAASPLAQALGPRGMIRLSSERRPQRGQRLQPCSRVAPQWRQAGLGLTTLLTPASLCAVCIEVRPQMDGVRKQPEAALDSRLDSVGAGFDDIQVEFC